MKVKKGFLKKNNNTVSAVNILSSRIFDYTEVLFVISSFHHLHILTQIHFAFHLRILQYLISKVTDALIKQLLYQNPFSLINVNTPEINHTGVYCVVLHHINIIDLRILNSDFREVAMEE